MNYLPFLLLQVILVLAPGVGFAQQLKGQATTAEAEPAFRKKPRIAVLPFQTSSARVKEIGLSEAITAMAVTELRNNSNFVTLERSQIRAVIDEQALAEMGLTESASEKLMKVLDVEVVLLGEIAYLGETIHIDARMVDIRTARVAVADFVQTNNIAMVRKPLADLVQRMLLEYLRPWMGSLEITSDPAGAEVYIDGDYVGTTARKKPVRVDNFIEGRYNVKLIAGGYVDWQGEIVVLPKMSQSFNIPLIMKPGSMTVSSEPPDAEVYMDNNLVGKTPLTLREVAEGEHDLRIVKETYQEWSQKVVVRSFRPTDVMVTLEVLPAMLVVRSEPSGASVYFMGRQRGTTPVTLSNLTPGEVVLRLTKMNYEEWVTSFLLAPNERREIDGTLVRQMGLLSVASIPDGAVVFLTDLDSAVRERIGVTPIFNYETTVGAYLVGAERKDYFTGTSKALVLQGRLEEIAIVLEEKPGRILVETVPENAQVFLDEAFAGRTPLVISDLKRGTYSIKLSIPYASTQRELEVLPDTETRVSHRFDKSSSYLLSAFWASMMSVLLFLIAGGQ
ncbi:MAG: PEGA domain-containing protein [Candidatus Marinimicrobia bacterium]|nr:PEGA domain-containing protein [Candidatus Neomarinimicrobiota bacterium]